LKKFKNVFFACFCLLFIASFTIGGEYIGIYFLQKQSEKQVEKLAELSVSQGEFVLREVLQSIIKLEKLHNEKCIGHFADQSQITNLNNPMIGQLGLLDVEHNKVYCTNDNRMTFKRSFATPPVRDTGKFGVGLVYMRGISEPYLQLSWRDNAAEKLAVYALVSPKLFIVSENQKLFSSLQTRFEMNENKIFDKKLYAYGKEWNQNNEETLVTGSIVSGLIANKQLKAVINSDEFPFRVILTVPFSEVINYNKFGIQLYILFLFLISTAICYFLYRFINRAPNQLNLIKKGVKKGEFIPFYQPIIDIQTGKLMGCEVLVRWQTADGVIHAPNKFIYEAEISGQIIQITTQLLEKINIDLGHAYSKNRHLKASVNLVSGHFINTEIIQDIKRIFADQENSIRYHQLEWEITERFPLKSLPRARIIVKKLQQLGSRVSLDDAGTGHGGLAYLQELGLDTIKIDKIFVDTIGDITGTSPIVDMLINLSEQMSMEIIAEGVEDVYQIDYLRDKGIKAAQGYVFYKPLNKDDYLELIWKNNSIHPKIQPFLSEDNNKSLNFEDARLSA